MHIYPSSYLLITAQTPKILSFHSPHDPIPDGYPFGAASGAFVGPGGHGQSRPPSNQQQQALFNGNFPGHGSFQTPPPLSSQYANGHLLSQQPSTSYASMNEGEDVVEM